MRHIVLGFLFVTVTAIAGERIEPAPGAHIKVLFLGNSYTFYNELPEVVAALSNASPTPIHIIHERSTPGGSTLAMHLADEDTLMRIEQGEWDVVVLQEQSMRPVVEPEKMFAAARKLDGIIRESGAKTMFFMTWARRHKPAMIEGLNDAYSQIADRLDAELAPVGMAWQLARETMPDLELYHSDGSHPSPVGTYLAACVIAARLTGQDPRSFDNPANLPKETAKNLREIAWLTLKGKRGEE